MTTSNHERSASHGSAISERVSRAVARSSGLLAVAFAAAMFAPVSHAAAADICADTAFRGSDEGILLICNDSDGVNVSSVHTSPGGDGTTDVLWHTHGALQCSGGDVVCTLRVNLAGGSDWTWGPWHPGEWNFRADWTINRGTLRCWCP